MCCAIALQLEAFLSVAVGVTSSAHACFNHHKGLPLTLGASACSANRKTISKFIEVLNRSEYGNSYAVTCKETVTNTEHVNTSTIEVPPSTQMNSLTILLKQMVY